MSSAASFPSITTAGRYLWRDNERFFVRGVVYQISCVLDPIADDRLPQLQYDVQLFKELGVNTLFVYSIDNTKSHDAAMELLRSNEIYVLTTVSTPSCSLNRSDPYKSYQSATVASFCKTADVMARYPNTLGILAGNVFVNDNSSLKAAPVIKAVVRDLKKHMNLKKSKTGQRVLPVGHSAATTGPRDITLLEYLVSGEESDSIDFWTFTNYSKKADAYDDLLDHLQNRPIPAFVSEYGGQEQQPRKFQETDVLFSPRIHRYLSGGCAYEFWQSSNEYGLVEILEDDGDPRWSSYQDALSRADDPTKVKEKQEIEGGTLLIFHDFAHYQAKLASVEDVASNWDRTVWDREGPNISTAAAEHSWPWEPEFQMPEACVDWELLEREME